MSEPRRAGGGEWRFQCRPQLWVSGTPEGGYGGSGGEGRPAVTLAELVDLHDEEFVRNAYHRLLLREADTGGLANALKRLRAGDINKIEFLGSLRYSPEGRKAGVNVAGLRTAYMVRRLFRFPVLGYLLRSGEILLSLPRVVRNMERFEAFTNGRMTELQTGSRRRVGELPSFVAITRLQNTCDEAQTNIEQQRAACEKLWERLVGMERTVRDIANVLFLTEGEREETGVMPQAPVQEATLDAAIENLRESMLGHTRDVVAGRPGSLVAGVNRAPVNALSERIDALATEILEYRKLQEAAGVGWAATRARVDQFAKSMEATGTALNAVKRQQEADAKGQERLERSIQSMRWDFKESRENLSAEVARSRTDLLRQVAGEAGARETLALELRGLLGQFETGVEQLRAELGEESERLIRRLETEIAMRDALAREMKAGGEEMRAAVLAELRQAHEALCEDVVRSQTDLQEQIAGEIQARETLDLELRGLLSQFEANIEQLRAAAAEESERLVQRLSAEISVREALAREMKAGDEGIRAAVGEAGEQLSRRLEAEAATRDALSREMKAGDEGIRAVVGEVNEQLSRRVEAEAATREVLAREMQTGDGAIRAVVGEVGEQLSRRLEAEAATREVLAQEVQTGDEGIRVATASMSAELQKHAAQFLEEAKARDWLGSHFDEEFGRRRELETRFKELERTARQIRNDLTYADWRISTFVAEARKRLPSPLNARQLTHIVDEHDNHKLDSLYAAFEDVFRGSREDIKTRQTVYLPYMKESKAGSRKSPIIDLGCGRGEWLELLREQDLKARGIDTNRIMVERCTELGLQAELSDAHTYLRKLKDGSAGCVTGFHIVEHMSFDALIELLDEVLRVLQPGGVAIFETPNPRNILVGSTEFYNDPTHVKPLPPQVLRFLAESRGLCKVEVLELHPYPKSYNFEDDGKGVTQRLNEYFYGPQDYSIIGRKA